MASIDDVSLSSSIPVVPDQPEKGYLAKRKDFLGKDEYADSHPNRTYYFKRNQDLNEVIETCTRKLYEDPNNMRALYLRGSSFFKKNYLDACIQDLTTVLRSQPTHQDCLYTRGLAYFKSNKHELAIKDLSRVLELNPDHVNAAYSRAACYNKMGLLTEAIEDYNFALSKDQSSNGSVASGANPGSNLMPPPSTPLFPSSSSRDDLASFGGSSSYSGGVTDTPKSVGTMSLSSYLHKAGRVETPRTTESGSWSAESSPPRQYVGSGNKKLDAIDAAGIFSLYEEGYESATSGTSGGRSQSRGRARVDSNDGSYTDSVAPIGNRRPSFSSMGTGNNSSSSNNRSKSPGANGFSFKSLSEMKRNGNSIAAQSSSQPSSVPTTPIRTPTNLQPQTQSQQGPTQSQLGPDGGFYAPPPMLNIRDRGKGGTNNTISNVSAASGENSNNNGGNNVLSSFNSNPLFPPPGSVSSNQQRRPTVPVSDYDLQAADQFHAEAFELRKKGNFQGAIEEYSKALKFYPAHFKSLFNRGFAYDKVGQFDMAIQDYSAAIEIEPNYPLCFYNRGITYDHMNQLQRAFDDFSTAILLYEEKMQQQQQQSGNDPSLITQSYVDFYQNRAFCGKKMSMLEQAIKDFTTVLSLSEQVLSTSAASTSSGQLPPQPQSIITSMHNYMYKAYYHRSMCFERLSNYQEAIQDVTKAIQEISFLYGNINSPGQPLPLPAIGTMVSCLTARANICEITQQFDQAFQDYATSLKCLLTPPLLAPGQGPPPPPQSQPVIANQLFTVHTARGKLHSRLEGYEKAIEDYSAVLGMVPKNAPNANTSGTNHGPSMWWSSKENLVETYHSRALCFKAIQDYSSALQDYQQIIRLGGNSPTNGSSSSDGASIGSVYQDMANCYKKLENYEAAIDAYSKMIDLSPKNVKAYNSRAFLFAKLNRFKDAVQDYSTVIHIDPLNSHAYHNRGISYDKMGLIDQAIADFSKVFELDAKQSMTSMNAADPAATAAVDKVVAMMKPVPTGALLPPAIKPSIQVNQPQGSLASQAPSPFGPTPNNNNQNTTPLPPPVIGRVPIVRPPTVSSGSIPAIGGRGSSISPTPSTVSALSNDTNPSNYPGNNIVGNNNNIPTITPTVRFANPTTTPDNGTSSSSPPSSSLYPGQETSSTKIRTPPKVLPPHPSMMNAPANTNTSAQMPVSSVAPPLSAISSGNSARILIPQVRPSVLSERDRDGGNSPPTSTSSGASVSGGVSASALLQQQGRSKTPISIRGRVVDNDGSSNNSSQNGNNSASSIPPPVTSSVAPPIVGFRPQTSFIRTPTVVTPQPSTISMAENTPNAPSGNNNNGMMNAASFLANLRGDSSNGASAGAPITIPMGRFSQR